MVHVTDEQPWDTHWAMPNAQRLFVRSKRMTRVGLAHRRPPTRCYAPLLALVIRY
jgi:hypothetical protein